MNQTLAKAGKEILKSLLSQLEEDNHMIFKRMYSPKNLELNINDVVDAMDDEKISWAITQCETTINKIKSGTIRHTS